MPEKKNLILRIRPELYEAVQRAAAQEFRSVNGQIEFILSEFVRERGLLRGVESTDESSDSTSET
jgi:hypothetical protein